MKYLINRFGLTSAYLLPPSISLFLTIVSHRVGWDGIRSGSTGRQRHRIPYQFLHSPHWRAAPHITNFTLFGIVLYTAIVLGHATPRPLWGTLRRLLTIFLSRKVVFSGTVDLITPSWALRIRAPHVLALPCELWLYSHVFQADRNLILYKDENACTDEELWPLRCREYVLLRHFFYFRPVIQKFKFLSPDTYYSGPRGVGLLLSEF